MARGFLRFYAGLLPRFEGATRVLDVGCGPAVFAKYLAQKLPKASVVGVDLDPRQIHQANLGPVLPNLKVRVGDASKLPFDAHGFDRVVTTESFHHWEHPATGVEEVHRVLQPGGQFLIVEMNASAPAREHRWLGGVRFLKPLMRPIMATHGYTSKGIGEVQGLVANVFDDAQVETYQGWWIVTATKR